MLSVIEIYLKHLPNLKKIRDEYRTNCPFHDDSIPSFYVNADGLFYCFGCGEGGNVLKFAKLLNIDVSNVDTQYVKHNPIEDLSPLTDSISEKLVSQYSKNLLSDKKHLEYILRVRRINLYTINKFQIGLDTLSDRFVFPIRDFNGKLKNLKFHNSNLIPKSYSLDGYGSPRLFPALSVYRQQIIICEGEFDCMLLHTLKLNGITCTSGSRTWLESWNQLFKNKDVIILYDSDEAGVNGSKNVYNNISKLTKSIKIITFPPSKDKTDITSYVKSGGNILKLISL